MKCDVVTTAFRGGVFVRSYLDSLLLLSSFVNKVILVIDGCDDDYSVVHDERYDCLEIRLLFEKRIGRGRCLNVALNKVSTEWLLVLDIDDACLPELGIILRSMQRFSEADDSICCIAGRLGNPAKRSNQLPLFNVLNKSTFFACNPISHSGTLIKTKLIRAVGGYDESRSDLYDFDLWVRFLIEDFVIFRPSCATVVRYQGSNQFFESRRRLQYLIGLFMLRFKLAAALPKFLVFLPLSLVSLVYGLIPKYVRNFFRRCVAF